MTVSSPKSLFPDDAFEPDSILGTEVSIGPAVVPVGVASIFDLEYMSLFEV